MPTILEQFVLDRGLVDDSQLEKAKRESRARNVPFAAALIDLGYLEERVFAQVVVSMTGCSLVDPLSVLTAFRLQYRIPPTLAREVLAAPISIDGNRLTVAMLDPTDRQSVEALASASNHEIIPVVAIRSALEILVNELYPEPQGADTTLFSRPGLSLDLGVEESPVEPTAHVSHLERTNFESVPPHFEDLTTAASSPEEPDHEYATMIVRPPGEPDMRDETIKTGAAIARPMELRADSIESRLIEIFRILATIQLRLDSIEAKLRRGPSP